MLKTFDELADEWEDVVKECYSKLPNPREYSMPEILIPIPPTRLHPIRLTPCDELPKYINVEDSYVRFRKIRTIYGEFKWVKA